MRIKSTFLISIIFLLVTCNQQQQQINSLKEGVSKHDEKKALGQKTLPEFEKQNVKQIVAKFSEYYTPERSESLESIPIDIVKAFAELRMVDKNAHEKYVTLIFVKLYAEHLECCHQSYIIATQPNKDFDEKKISMVNEFAKMSGYLEKENSPEIWTSGIIEEWLSENPRLLKHEPIAKYSQYIKAIKKKIASGEYWENKK